MAVSFFLTAQYNPFHFPGHLPRFTAGSLGSTLAEPRIRHTTGFAPRPCPLRQAVAEGNLTGNRAFPTQHRLPPTRGRPWQLY